MHNKITVMGMTNQVKVASFNEGRAWYVKLFGREPDFMAGDKFHEWEILPGCWLQLAEGDPGQGNGPIRFGVKDIYQERERAIRELNVEVSEVELLENVVAWVNFYDPYGNRLGFFQDLALSS